MEDFRGHFRDLHGHPDIVVAMKPAYKEGAEWLLAFFQSEIQRGVVFGDGQTVQIGWMLVMLKNDQHQDLEIWEPRFDAFPIAWQRGADLTYRFLTMQREVCRQIGVEPEFPSLAFPAVMAPDFLTSTADFKMSREEHSARDSGWFFGELDFDGTDAKYCSLFQISLGHMLAIPFMALPPGAAVQCTKDRVEVFYGETSISSDTNEFLARLRASPAFD